MAETGTFNGLVRQMGGEIKTYKSDFTRIMIKPFMVWGWVFNENQVEMLYPMVAEFSADSLEKATQHLLRESKFKPKPAEIIEACKKCSPELESTGKYQKAMDELDRQDSEEVAAYVKTFLSTSDLAAQARQEGWSSEFDSFVRHTASTMHQMIRGRNGYGWSSQAVPHEYIDVYKKLLKDAKPKVRSEGISVRLALPYMAAPYWRTVAAQKPVREETEADISLNAMMARVTEHFKMKANRNVEAHYEHY